MTVYLLIFFIWNYSRKEQICFNDFANYSKFFDQLCYSFVYAAFLINYASRGTNYASKSTDYASNISNYSRYRPIL